MTIPSTSLPTSIATFLQILPTPAPSSSTQSHLEKRRRAGPKRADHQGRFHHLHDRAGASSGPTFDDYPSCDNVGNTLLSCFPQSNTTLTQAEWSKFIWNANYPTFVENGQVDILLYQADSGAEVQTWPGVTNAQGSIEIRPEEDWWKGQDRAREIKVGETETFSYYFVVIPGGQTLDGGEPHQNTFRAVQTAPLSAALASISSASVASVSSLSAAVASSSASASSAGEGQGGRATDGTLQNGNSNGPGFPKWVSSKRMRFQGVRLQLTPRFRVDIPGNRGHYHPRRLPTHLAFSPLVFPPSRISSKKSQRGSGTVGTGVGTERRRGSCRQGEVEFPQCCFDGSEEGRGWAW